MKNPYTYCYQFESPVANAWIMRKGKLTPVSVFDNKHIPAISSFQSPEETAQQEPLLYVGKYK